MDGIIKACDKIYYVYDQFRRWYFNGVYKYFTYKMLKTIFSSCQTTLKLLFLFSELQFILRKINN